MQSRKKWIFGLILAFSLADTVSMFAQDPNPPSPPPSGGWRRFDPSTDAPPPAYDPQQQPQGQPRYQQAPQVIQAPPPSSPTLTVPSGTWIVVRLNEPISSDHNQPGDPFTATLAEPLVVNGRVIARRGQTVSGVVTEAKKAGRASGLSKLGLELVQLRLADGDQVQVKTSPAQRHGDTSYGRDAAGIAATVGTGAAIGAAVNGGVGAGIGAAAGVVASTIGVLLTRGTPTVVYPEQPLTFRLETPITVDAYNDAFQPVQQQDYNQRAVTRRPGPGAPGGPGYSYGPPPPPAYYPYGPYYYGGYFGPYYGYGFGPSFYFSYGRGFHHRW